MLSVMSLQARWQKALPSFLSRHSWSTTLRWSASTSSKRSRCRSETSSPSPDSSVRKCTYQLFCFPRRICFSLAGHTFIVVVCFLIFCRETNWMRSVLQSSGLLMWTSPAVKSTTWKEAWREEVSWRVCSRWDLFVLFQQTKLWFSFQTAASLFRNGTLLLYQS